MPKHTPKKVLTVFFYQDKPGKAPALEFIKELSKSDRLRVGEDLQTLQYGWPLGMPLVKSLERRIQIMKKFNKKHIGPTLDSFLQEEGVLEKTEAVALKRIIAYQLLAILEDESITQTELAQRMKTSKAAINRLLNPENPSITLATLLKVAHALGKNLQISIG